MKILIIYGTRYGQTRKSALVLKEYFESKGYSTEITTQWVSFKIRRRIDVYDLVIMGTSIVAAMWKAGLKSFLKRHSHKIQKLAVFITAAGYLEKYRKEKMTEEEIIRGALEKYSKPFLEKNNILPVAQTVFGGKKANKKKFYYDNWQQDPIEKWADKLVEILNSHK